MDIYVYGQRKVKIADGLVNYRTYRVLESYVKSPDDIIFFYY